jgi:hypothetical protein
LSTLFLSGKKLEKRGKWIWYAETGYNIYQTIESGAKLSEEEKAG